MTLEYYLSLFPGAAREKARFMAPADIQNLYWTSAAYFFKIGTAIPPQHSV